MKPARGRPSRPPKPSTLANKTYSMEENLTENDSKATSCDLEGCLFRDQLAKLWS